MKKVFVTLNQDQSVSVSMQGQYDEEGNIIMLDGYDGPYDVPDSFATEQHLYVCVGDELVIDRAKYDQAIKDREAAENQLDPITELQLAMAELFEEMMRRG